MRPGITTLPAPPISRAPGYRPLIALTVADGQDDAVLDRQDGILVDDRRAIRGEAFQDAVAPDERDGSVHRLNPYARSARRARPAGPPRSLAGGRLKRPANALRGASFAKVSACRRAACAWSITGTPI